MVRRSVTSVTVAIGRFLGRRNAFTPGEANALVGHRRNSRLAPVDLRTAATVEEIAGTQAASIAAGGSPFGSRPTNDTDVSYPCDWRGL
jgi:hypothetical protein